MKQTTRTKQNRKARTQHYIKTRKQREGVCSQWWVAIWNGFLWYTVVLRNRRPLEKCVLSKNKNEFQKSGYNVFLAAKSCPRSTQLRSTKSSERVDSHPLRRRRRRRRRRKNTKTICWWKQERSVSLP